MVTPLKIGGLLGIVAALIILLFGGWVGILVATALGGAAAVITCQAQPFWTLRQGSRLGQAAGATVGLISFLTISLQAWFVLPAIGKPALSLGETALISGSTLILATLSGTGVGALQGVHSWWINASLILTAILTQVGIFFIKGDPELLPTCITGATASLLFGIVFFLLHRSKQTPEQTNHLLLMLFVFLIPALDQATELGWLSTIIQILIFSILALGLNITVGYAGLLDLGYAAFFAIGAYTTGLLASPHLGLEWNFWIVIWVAAAVTALAGILLGSPTLPLRGDYLAIVTLGFGEIVPVLFRNLTQVRLIEPISSLIADLTHHPEWAICLLGCVQPINLTGGEAGINPIGRPSLPLLGTFQSGQNLPWYYLILGLLLLSWFLIERLRNSRLGRAWAAMREDELAASTMGISLVQTKLTAFAMGASFSGLAGAFYASYIRSIFPTVFDFSVSVIILCMVILGGLGNMAGVLLGSIIIMGTDRLLLPQLGSVLKDFLRVSVLPNISDPVWRDFLSTSFDPIQMRLFLFGFTLVATMVLRPEGLLPNPIRRAELQRPTATEERRLSEKR
jgi:branched-chain amino acid transport system permease protein